MITHHFERKIFINNEFHGVIHHHLFKLWIYNELLHTLDFQCAFFTDSFVFMLAFCLFIIFQRGEKKGKKMFVFCNYRFIEIFIFNHKLSLSGNFSFLPFYIFLFFYFRHIFIFQTFYCTFVNITLKYHSSMFVKESLTY